MGKLLSTSKSSNDSTREPIIIPSLQSMPTTGPENKGILKSAVILNQPSTGHKSSTNNQQVRSIPIRYYAYLTLFFLNIISYFHVYFEAKSPAYPVVQGAVALTS